MAGKYPHTDWTGKRGERGAKLLASPWRRFDEIIFGRSRTALMEKVLSAMQGGEVLLDAGCGSGYLSLPVAARLETGKVVCLDLSEEMLASLEKRARSEGLLDRIQVIKAAADDSGLESASVDIVISNNLLHELSDPGAGIAEWARVLRPGGCMLLSDFRATRPVLLFMRHRHGEEAHGPFTVEGLDALLREKGMTQVEVAPYRHTLLAQATM